MRIGFDMQALQSVNKTGGIGKYNNNFLKYLFKLYPDNKYDLFYNGRYKNADGEFSGSPNVRSHIINYWPYNDLNPINRCIQYSNYRSKSLDLLHILSPFEHQYNAVISNKRWLSKKVVTIYDFIPFIFKNLYLKSAVSEKLYSNRLKILYTADIILSISESTKRDAINLFKIPAGKIVNIGLAASDKFYKIDNLEADAVLSIRKKYGIKNKFILTVSNLDHRKNLIGVLRAFVRLPADILNEFSLIIVCNSEIKHVKDNKEINELISHPGNAKIEFLYFIPDEDLNILYNTCHLFIYASLYEGGGLPVIEAMKCGAPVIASNTSSIPELIGRSDMLFNPGEIENIVQSIITVVKNEDFRIEIGKYGQIYSRNFSWENVVQKTMKAYEHILNT